MNSLLILGIIVATAFSTVQTFAQKVEVGSPLAVERNSANLTSGILTICLGNINQARRNNGKGPVVDQSQVEQAAYNHNSWMVRNNCFSHQCPGEPPLGDRLTATGYRWRGIGEILTAGPGDCTGAINSWLNSPGHKDIMLGDYMHVGCSGLICNNCQYGTYWTCVFASN